MLKRLLLLLMLASPVAASAQSADGFFTPVSYKGAFGGSNWLEGWTALSAKGYLAPTTSGQTKVQVTDASINAGDNVRWTSNNIYVLNGVVLVEEGATLTIEPGTTVQGELGNGNRASALVIGRGGKLFAEGTSARPIVFTSVLDDGSLTYQDRGLWGGVVVLGRATTNNPTTGGEKQIEGLNEIIGTRALYGGTDDNDASGILRHVSIRHTGINVGDQAGNEIQGLTLGGVGRGTVIEYIESFASADDGFEFFGGTVDTKYLVSAFNEDDSFDWDEGFRGRGQFWFSLQATDKGGRAGEFDGATNNEFYTPYAIPVLSNVTFIGPGLGATTAGDGAEMIIFRDNSGGKIYNSIFTEYQAASGGKAVTVEDVADNTTITTDSRQRLEAGDLVLSNNLWWQFGAGNTVNTFATQAWVQAHLAAQPNSVIDPALRGIDRDAPNATLDPRPAPGSPALSGAMAVVGTAIETTAGEILDGFVLDQNYPNPFNPSTTIEFGLDRSEMVRLSVYDLLGREVAVLVNDVQSAGTYRVSFDATDLASGVYLYRLATGAGSVSRRMVLMK